MYEFNSMTPTEGSQAPISSVAVTIGGKTLDTEVAGFRTLTVEGRELLGSSLSFYDDIPGRDGAWVKEETLPARQITVNYQIQAENNAEYRAAFALLNSLLRSPGREDRKIIFADEPEYFFMGRLAEAAQPETGTNTAKSSFVLYCQDPYKYHEAETVTGNPAVATLGGIYPFAIKSIEVTIPADAQKVIIRNETTGRRIILNGSFTPGQVLKVEKDSITLNGQNIMSRLDYLESDWHQFKIREGDTISATPATPVTLVLKRRLL